MHTRIRFLLLLPVLATLAGCDPGASIRVENTTDQRICIQFYGGYVSKLKTPADGEATCDWMKPNYSASWGTGCYDEEVVWIVIKVKETRYYEQSATCKEWERTVAPVVIEESEDGILVYDQISGRR